jgi:hypothetical protein
VAAYVLVIVTVWALGAAATAEPRGVICVTVTDAGDTDRPVSP